MSLNLTHPTAPNTIVLKGELAEKREEGEVDATFTIIPGMLVERTTAAGRKFKPHATAGALTELLIAEEFGLAADIPGQTTFKGGTIDDTYDAGDPFPFHICQPGDVVYVFLPAAAAAVLLTDFLTSNGDGRFKKVATTDARMLKPLEAVDNSAGASPVRIRGRVV